MLAGAASLLRLRLQEEGALDDDLVSCGDPIQDLDFPSQIPSPAHDANLEGLFAAGEDSSGVHGANRLGGNGVAESTVFGARVGDAVAQWVKGKQHGDLQREQLQHAQAAADRFLQGQRGETPFALRDELGRLMWDRAGIVRNGQQLRLAIDQIAELANRLHQIGIAGGRNFNLSWQQALDMRNLLLTSELIARSALLREDSRGAHYRDDFPDTDNTNWLKNIYLARDGNKTKLWTESVKLLRLRP